MSAPLPSLLADKLDVSEKKAKKLLVAMLREVKKRAARKGVQLPEFGTFWVEDGQLTFDPDPSLARAVNQQFEGLESEDLDTAPIQTSPQEEEKSDEGPDTITLGYQDSQDSSSDWTPIDSEDEPAEEEDEETDDAPDTAEFQVPSAEQAADTDELQAQEDDATDPEPEPRDPEPEPREPEPEPREPEPEPREQAPDSHTTEEETEASPDLSSSATGPSSRDPDQSHTQTEELYPLVEEVSGSAGSEDDSSSPDQQVDDEERESLSGIWDEDDQAEAPEPSSEPDSESTPEPEPDSAAETEPEPAAQTEPEPTAAPEADPSAQTQPVIDPEPAAESSGAESPAEVSADADAQEVTAEDLEEEAAADGGSTGTRVLAGALVLLLLGGAGWYVLGQRGTVPPPGATFAQLQSQVKDLPLVGSTTGEPSSPAPDTESGSTSPATADAAPSGAEQEETQTPAPSTSESTSDPQTTPSDGGDAQSSEPTSDASSTTAPSETESSTPSAPSDETERASPRGLNPSAGGWTIIVASRTQRDPAESLVQNYRNIFAGQNLPVGILTGTVDGKTRYRIGVGQFSSRSEAQAFLKKAGDKLPQGAWMLSL